MDTTVTMQAQGLVPWMGALVERFNREIIGWPVPVEPRVLPQDRAEFRMNHVKEEIDEFLNATLEANLPEAADAIIDLVYVALGALVEMGVCVAPAFAEVHRANMEKVRGTKPNRPDNQGGYDAIKPAGWRAPDHSWLVTTTPEEFRALFAMAVASTDETQDGYIGLRAKGNLAQSLSIGDKAVAIDGITIGDVSPVYLEVTKVRIAKGNDYNATVPLAEYFPFGHESYAQMLWVKILRIRNLVTIRRKGGKPIHEGLRDSVLDLINYSTYYVEAVDRNDKYLEG